MRHEGSAGQEPFHHLCYELLQYSTKGLLRKDFLPQVSEMIKAHAGCDAVDLWVKEGPRKHFRCSITGSKRMPFGFILVPCPLGEATGPPPQEATGLDFESVCCDIVSGSVDELSDQMTDGGSYWARKPALQVPAPFKDIAIIPVRLEEECIGLLILKSRKKAFFTAESVRFYEDVSAVLGIALSHQYAKVELRERIKEITCLYGIARVVARPDASFDEIIQGIVQLLPPAWLYPEITCARITLNGRSYETEGFRETPYRQTAGIVVKGERVGSVDVVYLEERLTLDEGPFLSEERSLIDSVAREVAIFHERARAEEEKASLQDQLRHADRLATIGQLAAGVAHELNEPLGNILGFAQLARKSPGLPDLVARDLENIESASLNAREIIKKLMAFARQVPPQKKRVNLNKVVEAALYFFEARSAKSDIRLVRRLAENLPGTTIDPGQITQVLVNLVVNAIQALDRGGTLTVGTGATDEEIFISVGDTGSGMDGEIADKIFLPFFTTKDVDEGTGLGLAVVHGIVTSHGGRIDVETELGKGSTFRVWLPRTG
jgi:signal transduction histidine kinase